MKMLTEQLTCVQCHCRSLGHEPVLPNCGAKRKEDIVQVSLRRLRGAALSALGAAVVVVIATAILGLILPAWSATVARKFPLLPGTFAMHLIGMLVEGWLG